MSRVLDDERYASSLHEHGLEKTFPSRKGNETSQQTMPETFEPPLVSAWTACVGRTGGKGRLAGGWIGQAGAL